MTTEQQRKILECAAKACGFKKWRVLTSGLFQVSNNENWNEAFAKWTGWNPLTASADCAEMCAKLLIYTCFYLQLGRVTCDFYYGTDNIRDRVRVAFKDHDNSRLKAWMFAATMVAAKIGGYTEREE